MMRFVALRRAVVASAASVFLMASPSAAQDAGDEEQWTRATLPDNFASVEMHCPADQIETAQRETTYGVNCEIDGKRITLMHIPEALWLQMSSVGDFETLRQGIQSDPRTGLFEEEQIAGFDAFRALSTPEGAGIGMLIARPSPDRLLLLMVRSQNGTDEEKEWVARSFEQVADSLVITGEAQ